MLWLRHAKFIVGVSGVVLSDRGVLLQHRYWMADVWRLPGGNIKHSERLEDALAREGREETGYEIEVGRGSAILLVRQTRVPRGNGGRRTGGRGLTLLLWRTDQPNDMMRFLPTLRAPARTLNRWWIAAAGVFLPVVQWR